MRKLFYVLAFILPMIVFTSCSKDDETCSSCLSGTEWISEIGFGDLVVGTVELKFKESTFIASIDMKVGEVEGPSSIEGTYTVDGNNIYMEYEGETETATLKDNKIIMSLYGYDDEELPMELIFNKK